MTPTYKYNTPEKTAFETLPPGEYSYTVIEASAPAYNARGNLVMPVKLAVGTEKKHVYDYPWFGPNGDKISQFLLSCNRAPAVGKEPDWNRIVGAKGRCKIVIEPASGQYPEKNKVSFYIFATDIKPVANKNIDPDDDLDMTPSPASDLKPEPTDIPF